ncbi:alpha/beta hydrolase [Massilia sp. CF038]|uniref:alpha/beta hydrolase n=1 Tax=Massilia sp. CF038 TaxID=1881045 RepID=UPI00091FB6F6|nr:alpha/beta hydrolase [Massilia sp. CF038]SHG38643.1 Acetyl esterase/lipase [Massilia sp. CF038]
MKAVLLLAAALALPCAAQTTVKLWPAGAPGSESRRNEPETVRDTYVSNVHDPSLTVFKADPRHANGAAVIVVPGGGHRILVMVNEGVAAAKALNRFGVTAFVLKYRLARDGDAGYTIEGHGAADLRRAVRLVRANATQYGIDPKRLGVMGFSAGGELVALVADNPAPPASGADLVERTSARPDFQVLVYPGPLGSPARAIEGAPPAFIVAGAVDKCCAPPAIGLYQQLVGAGVSAELHLYADTDHAFNMGARSERVSVQRWPDRLHDWLLDGGWMVQRGDGPPQGVPAPTPNW